MPQVIVPLDGSELAESAVPYARAFAAGGSLVLMTATGGLDGAVQTEYLERVGAGLTGVGVETMVVHDRDAPAAVHLLVERYPDALVCMATHGRSGLGEAVLGSVAEQVIRAATAPVLLVGPHVAKEPRLGGEVLVAVDTPATASAITVPAAALAAQLGAPTHVVEVVAPPPIPLAADSGLGGRSGDGDAAQEAVRVLGEHGSTALIEVVPAPDPADAIVDLVGSLPASVVVVGTHARAGLARMALGSVAMRVVRRASCPVLVVRS